MESLESVHSSPNFFQNVSQQTLMQTLRKDNGSSCGITFNLSPKVEAINQQSLKIRISLSKLNDFGQPIKKICCPPRKHKILKSF